MNSFVFKYKIKTCSVETGTVITNHGIAFGETSSQAVNTILDYYVDGLYELSALDIEELDIDNGIIEMGE